MKRGRVTCQPIAIASLYRHRERGRGRFGESAVSLRKLHHERQSVVNGQLPDVVDEVIANAFVAEVENRLFHTPPPRGNAE